MKKQEIKKMSKDEILKNIDGIQMIYLDDSDVIRHQIVRRIIDAYNKIEDRSK